MAAAAAFLYPFWKSPPFRPVGKPPAILTVELDEICFVSTVLTETRMAWRGLFLWWLWRPLRRLFCVLLSNRFPCHRFRIATY